VKPVKNNYNIKVEYPELYNKKFDNKIKDIIDTKIEDFKKKVKILESSFDHSYELNISYTIMETDRLYSIHMVIYEFIGGANYEREDFIFYFDYIDEIEVSWEALFKDKSETLKTLSTLSSKRLKTEYKEYIYNEKEEFEEGVKPVKNNYKYLMLSDEGMTIIFPPYKVAPGYIGDISINLSYSDIDELLTDKYRVEVVPDENPIDSYKRKTRDINQFKDQKLIAITFDDGPSKSTTERLLDELRKRDARVTFFVLGNRVRQHPEIVKKAYDDGHTIGSHTYSHKNLKNLDDKSLKVEIDRANDEIEKVIGKKPTILRPPYGEYNKHILNASKMTFILWSVDPKDWKYRNSDTVYSHIMDNAKNGSIILLHDLYESSVDAALMAIDSLLEEGYAIVSLEELEQLGKFDLNSNQAYYRIK
jgi:peptidoglycan/xylan/chitin deacetylase (PgdA/CDA1 family)